MKIPQIKFCIDVGVGIRIENYLQSQGYDVLTIRSIDPRMSDEEILKLAVREARMVVTMDKDFGELVYHSSLPHKGVLLLRLEDATGDEKLTVIRDIMEKYADRIKNNFCVYQNHKFRIRKLKND